MIYNSSEYTCDFLVKNIPDAPLQVMFFKIDKFQVELSKLESETRYDKPHYIYNQEQTKRVRVYVIPTQYNQTITHENWMYRVDCKNFAIERLYEKWCKENDKAKQDPYKCKTFMQYLEELGLMGSDYAIIMC